VKPRLIGFDLGKLYVDRYFPAANKARAEAMVANILAAYREGVTTLDWMGPDSRREALAKLEAIAPRIAYPPNWRNYGGLEIRKDDLIGNVMRARRFDYDYWMIKLGTRVDRAEWRTTPQTVDAFYSASRNESVSGRHPAATVLRCRGRRRRQLWRHRLGDRSRNQPRLRRSGQPVRQQRQSAQLVDRRRSLPLRRQEARSRRAI
jgi:predicted metalloendopeptidase